MATTSPLQGLPVPTPSDDPDIPADLMALAQAIESRVNMRFANASARNSTVTSPVEGMTCYLTDTGEYQVYAQGEWRTFYTARSAGSGSRYGHLLSYDDGARPPATSMPGGMLGVNRTKRKLEIAEGDQWRAAAPLMAFNAHRHGGGGLATPGGSNSLSVSLGVTTSEPNTELAIWGVSEYSLRGVFQFLATTGGFLDVTTILYVIPPGGGRTELRRWIVRDMNTGGSGSDFVGGPTPKAIPFSWKYTATAVGNYSFEVRMATGVPPGNGSANNLGGEIMIMPVVGSTAF